MASDDIRSHAMAAAAATLSDSAPPRRSGIVTSASQCASTSAGSPSRSAPRQSVARPLDRSKAPAAVGDQRRPRRRRLLHPAPGDRLAEDRPHARPRRLRPVRVGAAGPEHHGAAAQRVGGADDRADVAGVGDTVQVETGGLDPLRPALRPDRDRPRSRTQRGDLRQQLGVDLLATEPTAGGGEHEARLDACAEPGLDQVLALGDEQPLALAVLALAQLADQLQLLVVGALDHSCCLLVSGFLLLERKRAANRRPAREVRCADAARRPHPPGLARRIGGTPRGR